MPRLRHASRAELVGLYVFGDGKAAEEVLWQVLGVFGLSINGKRRKVRRFCFSIFFVSVFMPSVYVFYVFAGALLRCAASAFMLPCAAMISS